METKTIMENKLVKVCVIGMGYVGFPLACAIAKQNEKYSVVGIDLNAKKLEKIKARLSPIDDRQAEEDIKKVNINATNDFSQLRDAKYIIIAVPTPVNEEKDPDLTPVKSAAREISKNLKKGQIIILESTVNPGVCEEEVLPILKESGLKPGIDFELAHCPERIDPGNPLWNVYNIPRNLGATSKEGAKIAADFYRTFLNAPVNEMSSLKAAESTKIVENTFRDINIAYVNELAKSFDIMGIDVVEVIQGASSKPFAFMAHYPGCGVGGHCIPVDPYYLIEKARKSGFEHLFLKAARRINNGMHSYTVQKLVMGLNELGLPVKGTKIAVLGLSYKANIADLRESPSFEIIKLLRKYSPDLMIYDPYVKDEINNVNLDQILKEAIGVIVATDHDEFVAIKDWKNIKLIVDGRNCIDKEAVKKKGIIYKGIGRS